LRGMREGRREGGREGGTRMVDLDSYVWLRCMRDLHTPSPPSLPPSLPPSSAKLETGLVSSVWLQLGSDSHRLEKGLQFLRNEAEKQG
jgi:hypothetical protein